MTTHPHSVLIVDDSAFMRKLISEMIDAEPDFTVVGFARNGVDALKQITALDPSINPATKLRRLIDAMLATVIGDDEQGQRHIWQRLLHKRRQSATGIQRRRACRRAARVRRP